MDLGENNKPTTDITIGLITSLYLLRNTHNICEKISYLEAKYDKVILIMHNPEGTVDYDDKFLTFFAKKELHETRDFVLKYKTFLRYSGDRPDEPLY
jgi:hypothetical protein